MSRPLDPWDEPALVPEAAKVAAEVAGRIAGKARPVPRVVMGPAPQAPAARSARTADLFAEWDAIEAHADAMTAIAAEARSAAGREPQAPTTLVVAFTVPGPPRGQARPRSVPLMRDGRPVIGANGRPMLVVHKAAQGASYESLIRLAAAQALGDREPFALPIEVEIDSYRTPAPSWAKRTQRQALDGWLSAAGKPDADNIAKAVLDACNGVVWQDDAQVVALTIRKRFAALARLEVRVAWTGLKAP